VTIVVVMTGAPMKYVINIKRKPSIIKKGKRKRKEKNTFILERKSALYFFVSIERHTNVKNEYFY
jgi:hypothetical protein